MDVNLIFYCKFCGHKGRTVATHLHHLKHHRNVSTYFHCGLGHCLSSFRSESSLRCHIIRNHKIFCVRQPKTIPAPQAGGKFICGVPSCRKEFFQRRHLMNHLRQHLDSGIQIPCPYSDCVKNFNSSYSLSGHISKKHRGKEIQCSNDRQDLIDLQEIEQPLNPAVEDPVDATVDEVPVNKDESLIALAQFYQKLEYKHMVPASVTQFISVELKTLLTDMNRMFLNKVTNILGNQNLPPAQIMDIVSCIESNEMLDVCNSLRSVYLRKRFYQDNFQFVLPERVPLENGSFYYYIPIDKTIQAAFRNRSWSKFSSKSYEPLANGLLQDFLDGETFKNNTFFQANPDAIPLIVYQDGFELVCPIGPAKNLKHKLEGIYMAFGNLPSDVRFQKDSIQLIALCRKSDFNRTEIYGRIVSDILQLAENGTDIPNVGNVKAGLAFIAGDNLGSHGLGGFLEGFSRTIFFCRYCLVKRPQFLKKGGEARKYETRTVESYTNAVTQVDSSRSTKSYEGVKADSPFNSIPGFHVCAPALSPCLGHDLCEGVIAYDMKLFIQHFIAKDWFTLSQLNSMITNFPYGQEDIKDKPCIIKKLEKPRLAGGAWQLYVFLRLFPLIIYGKVKDASDPVWQLLLKLKEIAQFTVAPEVHVSHLPSFQCAIDEYLVIRRKLFPTIPLRPKHHYMSHYPELILYFGPLIKAWTLRFESKHTFFTRSWKSSNNSINILQTLAFKHEYLQSWLRSGAGSRCDVETADQTVFMKSVYSQFILEAISKHTQVDSLEECGSVTIRGTLYKKGNIVVLRKLSSFDDLFLVGIVHLILVDSQEQVLFLVKRGEASLIQRYGCFKIKLSDDFECVKHADLLSYYPLHPYVRSTETCVSFRHAIVNLPLDI